MQLPADRQLIEKLVVANRILARHGIVDGFGHVSVRMPTPDTGFLLARSLAPASVTAADIMRFDLDGNAQEGDSRTPYLERFIHGEIYRARPDVEAVVHNHSPSVISFGVTGQALRPVFHMSGFLGEGTALFEIRNVAGDTDMLVSNGSLGVALVAALGSRSAVLMRRHGSTLVRTSPQQAGVRAIYAEVHAPVPNQAITLREVTYLKVP